ncbi:MAG TPA: hypothetical protein VFR31_02390 [Thermoanaerobaculia bacterium]|nr:hypothetical protein [Thermoanaerobaculia bacterium]
MQASYSALDILDQLDDCADAFTFPILDNAYVYPADTRMTLFRDETRWAMLIEVLGFNSHMGGTGGIDNALYCFGNCLRRPPGISPEDTLRPVSDGGSGPLFEADGILLRRRATDLLIRSCQVPVPRDPEHYRKRKIDLEIPPDIQAFELLRGLLPEHRGLLLATEEEIRARIPEDLPQILQLDEWYHPDISDGDSPSSSSTFQALAKVLVTGDTTVYRPRRKPNTHWSKWPEGGVL